MRSDAVIKKVPSSPPTRKHEFKNFHTGERFRKVVFSVNVSRSFYQTRVDGRPGIFLQVAGLRVRVSLLRST